MTQPAADPGPLDQDGSPLEPAEILDSDDLGSTDAGRDPLSDSWDAPDRPSTTMSYRTTPREEREGAGFDRLLAAEIPDTDPYLEAERRAAEPPSAYEDFGEGDVAPPPRPGYDPDSDTWVDPAESSAVHIE